MVTSIASSTSIDKLKVMQNVALRTVTGFTQDTNLHHETLTLPIHKHLHTAQRLTIQTENITSITFLTQTYNMLQDSKAKNTLSSTTAATQQTFPQTPSHISSKLHPHAHHVVTHGFMDKPRRSDSTTTRWTANQKREDRTPPTRKGYSGVS